MRRRGFFRLLAAPLLAPLAALAGKTETREKSGGTSTSYECGPCSADPSSVTITITDNNGQAKVWNVICEPNEWQVLGRRPKRR